MDSVEALHLAEAAGVAETTHAEVISHGYVKRISKWNEATLALVDIGTNHEWEYTYELDANEYRLAMVDPTFRFVRYDFDPTADYAEGDPMPLYEVAWNALVTTDEDA